MARHNTSLSTLQARTILSAIVAFIGSLCNRENIEKAALSIVASLEKAFPVQFPTTSHFSFVAFALSQCAKEGIKRGELKILDYLSIIAEVKQENEKAETSYNGKADFGAFGDLLEILVRCAMMRKIALVRWSMLSVKDIKNDDITSKKFGIVEVGHNGKTLSFGTMFDYMEGSYTSVVYGMFSEEDKADIYSLVRSKEYDKAVDYVANYCGYWANKYDFQSDMDNLTRGKGITAKGENIQVVYNDGKYNAFQSAIEEGKIFTLADALK